MSYRRMTFRQVFDRWMLVKELKGTGKGKDFVATLALFVNQDRDFWFDRTGYGGIMQKIRRPDYNFFVKNLSATRAVFEEGIMEAKKDKANGIREWIKKQLYISMLKNAIELSVELTKFR